MEAVGQRWRPRGGETWRRAPATDEEIARVHVSALLRRWPSGRADAAALDPDTYASPESYEVARLAAGAAVDAVERVMARRTRGALALVRPPGHHAERDRAMGFCLFNNVAVGGGARARARRRARSRSSTGTCTTATARSTSSRPTARALRLDAPVSVLSRAPARPTRSGAARARASRSTCRSAGAATRSTGRRSRASWCRSLRQFGPEFVLVSAGFDAHERDPLGGMRVTTPRSARWRGSCSAGRRVLRRPHRRGPRGRLRSAGARRLAGRGNRLAQRCAGAVADDRDCLAARPRGRPRGEGGGERILNDAQNDRL